MKRLAITVFITFLVCIAAIFVKNEYGKVLYKNANYGLERIIEQGGAKNLFVGSSMFRQGIDIFAAEKALGEDCFILAYNGNQPILEYYELFYLLKNGARFERVYLDMYAYSVASPPKISDERILLQSDFSFKRELYKELKKAGQGGVWWEMFVTSNNKTLLTYPVSYRFVDRLYHKGGSVQTNRGTTAERLVEAEMPKIESSGFNEIQKTYLEKIIALCRENQIEMIFIETPKYHSVSEDASYQSVMRAYIGLLQENTVDYVLSSYTAEQLHIADKKTVAFDSFEASSFLDYVHLSSDGRKKYSALLVQ